MKRDTFQLICQPDGLEYVIQNIDEMDKNHSIKDTDKTNEGRMYATEGTTTYNATSDVNLIK